MPPHITRLLQRADFLRLREIGSKAVACSLVLQAARHPSVSPDFTPEESAIRLGFTTSKKLGNAVTRNRIRRRLKAVADDVMPPIARRGYDYVIIGRKAALDRTYEELTRDLRYALRRIHAAEDASAAARPAAGAAMTHQKRESAA